MKFFRIPAPILIGIIILISILTFLFDLLEFYSSVDIPSWNYINETLNLSAVFFYLLFLRTKPFFSETDVKKNLKLFIKLLAILYVVLFLSRLLINPSFSSATFPQSPETIRSVIYSNIATILTLLTFTPMIIVIKNLINYRRKKRTRLYFNLTIIFGAITVILTMIFKTPLDINFEGAGIFSNTAFLITLLFLLIISFRNSWITFLSRKEKLYYFFISIIVFWVIYMLRDLIQVPVGSHSLALGVVVYLSLFFHIFYSLMATLFLMLQLPTARVFDRKMKEVSSLYNLSRAISVEFNIDKLVQMVTNMSSEVIESSFTWLELYDDEEHVFTIGASKNLSEEELSHLKDRQKHSVSERIINDRSTFLVNDVPKSDVKNAFEGWDRSIGSFAGVPLLSTKGKVFGILYAAKSSIFGFDPDDVNLLEAYASQAAIALENAHLVKISLERERMEKELQIAREVQLRLLPQETPELLGAEIETLTIAAYEVGGDYYDFYRRTDSGIGLVIGDVSGKGTSAAFYMAETKGIIQSLAHNYDSPRDILIQTNKLLYSSMERKSFISLLAANLDLSKNKITFARAGHCPIIHFRASENKTFMFQTDGIAVGLNSGELFERSLEQRELDIENNDILAFYTDGLSEARNFKGDEFGEEKLCEIIRNFSHLSVSDLKDVIIDQILKFLDGQNLHDDLTLILIKV